MNSDRSVYNSQQDKSKTEAYSYSKTHEATHRYLAYRDIPAILKKYNIGKKALDYGTGTGCSAEFLKKLGFNVTGVDVSAEMLSFAKLAYPDLQFHQVRNGIVPLESDSYDLVFSSFVLFEMGSPELVTGYLKEACRLLKRNGLFLGVTGSQDLHSVSRNWMCFGTDFPQNKQLVSGNLVKLYQRESDIEFTDYYWTANDYRQFFTQAGFDLIELQYPLGDINEPYPWKDELIAAPFIILVARIKS